MIFVIFFFNDTATTEIYTLSLHDALPISVGESHETVDSQRLPAAKRPFTDVGECGVYRVCGAGWQDRKSTRLNSKSRQYLVCRLLLEKKKNNQPYLTYLHHKWSPE